MRRGFDWYSYAMIKEEMIAYWIRSATEDVLTAESLFEGTDRGCHRRAGPIWTQVIASGRACRNRVEQVARYAFGGFDQI